MHGGFLRRQPRHLDDRRAVHHLDHQDDEFADSNLVIEPFDSSDPVLTQICSNLGVATTDAAGGARFWWESNLKEGARSDDHAAVLIDAPHKDDPRRGFLLRDKGYVEKQSVVSTYASPMTGCSRSQPATTPMWASNAAGSSPMTCACG